VKHIFALLAALLLLGVAPAPRAPLWTRTLPAGPPIADPRPLIAGTVVIVRSGYGLVALDLASGKTRWSLPSALDVGIGGDALAVARTGAVEAVRATDGGVLWKHVCKPAPFVVAWPDRLATLCSGRIAILRSRDGAVMVAAPLPRAARGPTYFATALNADYFALSNDVAHTRYAVVDAHTGVVRWTKANAQIVTTGARWIDLTPAGAGGAATVERHDLASGKVIATHRYTFGVPVDPRGTPFYASTAAVYAIAGAGELYRSELTRDEMRRITPEKGSIVAPTTLGAGAFYGTLANGVADTATMHVERFDHGTFKQTALGAFDATPAIRAGKRVALNARGTVTLFDEQGNVDTQLRTGCSTLAGFGVAAHRYVLLCTTKTSSMILGFARI